MACRRLERLVNTVCAGKVLPVAEPASGAAMVYFPQIHSSEEGQANQIRSRDVVSSSEPGKELTAGLCWLQAGCTERVCSSDEIQFVVEGTFHLTDGTGQSVVAKAGDVVYCPTASRITTVTPHEALILSCGQRVAGTAQASSDVTNLAHTDAESANPPFEHFPRASRLSLPKLGTADTQAWSGDVAVSSVPGRELAAGFFQMHAGRAFEHRYEREEMMYIVEGEFHMRDGTGQFIVAKRGDLIYLPQDALVTVDTPSSARGFFCGRRLEKVLVHGAGDFGQHRLGPMLFAGALEQEPIPLTFIDADRPVNGKLMGLKTLTTDYSRWLMIDATYEAQMSEKQRLLKDPACAAEITVTEHSMTLETAARTLAAKREAMLLVVDHILRVRPDMFQRRGEAVYNRVLGETVPLNTTEDPLLTASRLVQEDLCLVEPVQSDDPGLVRFSSGVVFFPFRWTLRKKVGKRLPAVHGPVAFFRKHYLKSAHGFFGTLSVEAPVSRGNWEIVDDLASPMDLHCPHEPEPQPQPTSVEEAGRKFLFRAEYQTLRRLPQSGAVLFTIRTYQVPLERFASFPFEASVFAARIRNLDKDISEAKSATEWQGWALRYLDSVADSTAPACGVP